MIKTFLFDLENLIEYWVSSVDVVSSNPCVGPVSKTKILFFSYQYAQISSCQHQK